MQTFLPFSNFTASAAILDNKRLGKQRVETMQIMTALTTGKGWIHHPATKMWRGHEAGLMAYQIATCEEWFRRGFQDTCLYKTWDIFDSADRPGTIKPAWLGDKTFHDSHKSNLLRKDHAFYAWFSRFVPDDLEYVWPV